MSRSAVRTVHAASATIGLLIIVAFFASTVAAELTGDHARVAAVKAAIFRALLALVPVMAVAGATGRYMAGASKAPVIRRKMRRMRLVAANAALVLVPCVVALHWLAGRGDFGPAFRAVQTVELLAGAINIWLLGRNLRDGLAMRRSRPAPARSHRSPQPS